MRTGTAEGRRLKKEEEKETSLRTSNMLQDALQKASGVVNPEQAVLAISIWLRGALDPRLLEHRRVAGFLQEEEDLFRLELRLRRRRRVTLFGRLSKPHTTLLRSFLTTGTSISNTGNRWLLSTADTDCVLARITLFATCGVQGVTALIEQEQGQQPFVLCAK